MRDLATQKQAERIRQIEAKKPDLAQAKIVSLDPLKVTFDNGLTSSLAVGVAPPYTLNQQVNVLLAGGSKPIVLK